MVNNTDGSVIGYKYFNLNKTYGKDGLQMYIAYDNEPVKGHVDIYVDRPTESDGGVKIGCFDVSDNDASLECRVDVSPLKTYNGKHAIYLVFSSDVKGKSICKLNEIGFELK